MARTNNLTNFLTDVANAIRTKKGTETDIPAADFDTEILALPAQGVYESRTINITQNGSRTITPNQGYDAIDELIINTNVPMSQLQTKTYSFTQNTTATLTPEMGYDGFSSVNVDINVSSPVQLYANRSAMIADNTRPIGTYGFIYDDNITGYKHNDYITSLYLPAAITLSSAYTGNDLRWKVGNNGEIRLSSSSIRYNIQDDHMNFSVSYTSSNGTIYTRTSVNNTGSNGTWDGTVFVLSSRLQVKSISGFFPTRYDQYLQQIALKQIILFDGIYKYNNQPDDQYINSITALSYSQDTSRWVSNNEMIYVPKIIIAIRKYLAAMNLESINGDIIYNMSTGIATLFVNSTNGLSVNINNNNMLLSTYNSDSYINVTVLTFNFTTGEWIDTNTITTILYGDRRLLHTFIENEVYLGSGSFSLDSYYIICNGLRTFDNVDTWVSVSTVGLVYGNTVFTGWHILQLGITLLDEAQLLDGIVGFGKYGFCTGDGSIISYIDLVKAISDKTSTDAYTSGIYIKGDLSITNDRSIATKVLTTDVDKYINSIAVVSSCNVSSTFAYLFESTYDNRTWYTNNYVIKFTGSYAYVFSKDLQTCIVRGASISIISSTAESCDFAETYDSNIIMFRSFSSGGIINLTTGEVTTLSTVSTPRSNNRACYINGHMYSATQSGLYRDDTKIVDLIMSESSGSYGYSCRYLNGKLYIVAASLTGAAANNMAVVDLSNNSVSYIDITSIWTSGYVYAVDSDTNDSLYYIVNSNLYSVFDTTITYIMSASGYTTSTPSPGYYPATKIIHVNNDICIINMIAGKTKYNDVDYSLTAYNARIVDSGLLSSSRMPPVMMSTDTIYSYARLDTGLIQITKIDYYKMSDTNNSFVLFPTGRKNINLLLPNDLSNIMVPTQDISL